MSVTRRHDRRAGFTLLELLVVVVILGIMGRVAMVASDDNDMLALDLVSIQIIDAAERARALAYSNRTAYGIAFDVDGDRFAVVDEFGNVVRHPVTKKDWEVDFETPGQPQRIDIKTAAFGTTGEAIVFDAQGDAIAGGSLTLERDEASRVLVLNAATSILE